MTLPVFLRPSTKFQTIDLTQQAYVQIGNRHAVVGEFERGPLKPTYTNGLIENFKRMYGSKADPTISFAYDTVEATMKETSTVLITRTVNKAMYAGATIFLDSDNDRLMIDPFPDSFSYNDYEGGLSQFFVLSFTEDMVADDTFDIDVTDGDSTQSITTVTYATSVNDTLANIAIAIQNALNTFGTGSSVKVKSESSGNNKLILIRIPSSFQISFTNLALDGTGVAVMHEDNRFADVFAENPGKWANDIGIKISNIDTGVRERWTLTIAGALVTSNVISVNVNETAVSATFDTDSDTTLAALATALEANDDIFSASVVSVTGGADNDRTIEIVVNRPGDGVTTISDAAVTLGDSQVAVSLAKTLRGNAADNSFRLEVFDRSNVNLPIDTYTVAFPRQLNSLGYSENISQRINMGSTQSVELRVTQSPESYDTSSLSVYKADGNPVSAPSLITWLGGGDDGIACTSAQIRQGWLSIEDRVNYPVDILLNGGYTAIEVQKEMAGVAERRSDCLAILDAPSDKQKAQTLREYRVNELDIDSSYVAMYTPDVLIADINTGEHRYIPPSGPIGATYSYSDRLTNNIGAPAGLNRGGVKYAIGLRHKYTPSEQELLYGVGLNYIEDRPINGPVVMAEETLQVKKTILSSVHARRILNIIKTGLVDSLDYTLFEPHTAYTRNNAIQVGETLLKPMTRRDGTGGLYDYRIKCDDDNNPPEVIDADQLHYYVYLKITRVVKGILVRGYLVRTGAAFEEIIDETANFA
jgi:hypothetical protein